MQIFLRLLFLLTMLMFPSCSKEMKEFLDEDNDGKYETIRYYKDGELIRIEKDIFLKDGKIDTWERYNHGKLSVIDYDRNGDGKVDRKIIVHTGRDLRDDDFDGKFEKEQAR